MARTLLILCLTAATLAAKDRPWQTGTVLDKGLNPYFKVTEAGSSRAKPASLSSDDLAVAVNVHTTEGDAAYDSFVIETADKVYVVELSRLKSYKAPHVSLSRPLTFAVEKDKLWIMDLDKAEYETKVLKQIDKQAFAMAAAGKANPDAAKAEKPKADPKPEPKVEAKVETPKQQPAKVEPKVEPKKVEPKVEQPKAESAKVEKPKAQKPDSVFATAALTTEDSIPSKPKPAAAPPKQAPAQTQASAPTQTVASTVQPKQNATAATVSKPEVNQSKPDVKADIKPEARAEAPTSKPQPKLDLPETKTAPRPQPQPERAQAPVEKGGKPEGTSARASSKDRAWQSGQLLSVANNSYFFNVTYSSDTEGTGWPFVQGSDGRFTVNGQIGAATSSQYTFDNYVLESQFVAYLVQRMRPKTSPAVRLPGTHTLKFAVEKNKLWVLDDEGKEYETKVVKLIQKDAIVDPLARAASR